MPLTVSPPVGSVTETVRLPVGGGGVFVMVPLLTLTVTLLLPVLPAASRIDAVSVWLPSATLVVFHGIVTGPVEAVCMVPTVLPPALNVYALDPAPAPSTHTIALWIPLTVTPLSGWVTHTVRPPLVGGGELGGGGVPGGGDVAPLFTVTVTLLLPVLPAASRTDAASTRLPLATLFVFHGIVTGPVEVVSMVPTVWPSAL